ncbi:MAG: DUF7019 family protein, partial [Ktedonobacteraceae bacterium]
MKYYIYISDAKVDMLYPQIHKPILKRIASSLNIDLNLCRNSEQVPTASDTTEGLSKKPMPLGKPEDTLTWTQ